MPACPSVLRLAPHRRGLELAAIRMGDSFRSVKESSRVGAGFISSMGEGLLRLLTVALLAAGAPLSAQQTNGRLQGSASDEIGRPLPGVTVSVRAVGGGAERALTADANGTFQALLPPGRYRLDFRLPSFATAVRTVDLEPGLTARVEAMLRVALNADVLVTGARTFRTPHRPRRAGQWPARPCQRRLGGRRERASRSSSGRSIARPRSSRRCRASRSASTAARARRTSTTCAASTSTTAPTSRPGSPACPINMPTHAHGQGYSDNNFLIPELVSGVQFQKGTYDAQEGDFSAAGAINVNYLNVLDRPLVKLEGGQDRFGRVLLAGSSTQSALATCCTRERPRTATAPGSCPDDFRKWNGVLRYSGGDQQNGFSLTAIGYSGRWHSTDQVPQRAVASGSPRPLRRRRRERPRRDSPLHARGRVAQEHARGAHRGEGLRDRLRPRPVLELHVLPRRSRERRPVRAEGRAHGRSGARVSQRFLSRWFGMDVESVAGLRAASTASRRSASTTRARAQRLETIREDDVTQSCGAALLPDEHPVGAEAAHDRRASRRPLPLRRPQRRPGELRDARRASLASPKLSLILGPFAQHRALRQLGLGLPQQRRARLGADARSEDGRAGGARGSDRAGEGRGARRAHGRGRPLPRHRSSSGCSTSTPSCCSWATRERPRRAGPAAGPASSGRASSRRRRGSLLDADLAYSKARFRDDDPAGDRIPGAVEGVASAGITLHDRGPLSGEPAAALLRPAAARSRTTACARSPRPR